MRARHLSAPMLCAAAAFASAASAQTSAAPDAVQPPPAGADAEAATEVEEIVVTAQRRSERLQDVPAAITALNAEALERAGVVSIEDIATRTPSFVIGQQGPSSPDLSIRGIGSSDRDAGSDRSVVVFIDEVYTGRAGGIPVDLFDLERVEVLRGPQGTLYGKNTVGGAVNFITRKPRSEFDAQAELTAGSRELLQARAAIGGALGADVAGRLAVSLRSTGPLYRNRFLGRDSDATSLAAGRAQILWRPTESLDVLVSGDYAHDEVDGISTHIDPVTPALLANGYQPAPDEFTGDQNVFGFLDRDVYGGSLRVDHETGFGVFTSLTAYRGLELAETRDLVGNPIRPGPLGFESTAIVEEESTSFSQDLRYATPDDGRAISLIAGLYYQTESTDRVEERKRQLNAARSRPVFDQGAETTSYAAFGEAVWEPTERLSLTLGGRYTVDEKSFSLTVSNPFGFASLSPATQTFTASASETFEAFSPRFIVDYELTPDALIYGSVSRGFKSGGFQGLAAAAAAARTPFNPEFVTAYEGGLKTSLLDRRLIFNVAAFRMEFEDLQFRQRILTIPNDQSSAIVIVANAGSAELYGGEVESSLRATDWLDLSLGYSFLDTEIIQFNATPGVTDVRGLDLARAPRNTLTLAADARFPVGGAYVVGARAEYRYRSSFLFEPSPDLALFEDGYGLFDARLTFEDEGGRWSIEAFGKNLADERYRTFAQAIGFATAGISAATTRTGDPRTLGVTVRLKY